MGEQGQGTEARALLAPLFEWFTKCVDAPDLIGAKVLLEQTP